MANTLILYDGRQSSAERVANAIGYIIGNVKISEIGDSPRDISVYDGFCFIFNFYGALTAGKTKSYLLNNREGLLGKRIAFVGMGFSDAGFTKYVVDMEFAVGGDLSITGMFLKDERTTSEVGYQIAKKLRAPVSVMPEDMLSREIDAFIARHTTLALSTGGGARIRCTPLEYLYRDGVFYIISEGGLKFSNILDNSNVSAAVFDEYRDGSQILSGLQIYGVAEQVRHGSDDYWQILSYRGVTSEVLQELPVTLFVLRIIPMTFEYLNSGFANAGYDARQVLYTRFRAERWENSVATLQAVNAVESADKTAAVKKETPRKAAIVAEKEVRRELGREIRNVLDESLQKKTAEEEEREYQEMSAFIDSRERRDRDPVVVPNVGTDDKEESLIRDNRSEESEDDTVFMSAEEILRMRMDGIQQLENIEEAVIRETERNIAETAGNDTFEAEADISVQEEDTDRVSSAEGSASEEDTYRIAEADASAPEEPAEEDMDRVPLGEGSDLGEPVEAETSAPDESTEAKTSVPKESVGEDMDRVPLGEGSDLGEPAQAETSAPKELAGEDTDRVSSGVGSASEKPVEAETSASEEPVGEETDRMAGAETSASEEPAKEDTDRVSSVEGSVPEEPAEAEASASEEPAEEDTERMAEAETSSSEEVNTEKTAELRGITAQMQSIEYDREVRSGEAGSSKSSEGEKVRIEDIEEAVIRAAGIEYQSDEDSAGEKGDRPASDSDRVSDAEEYSEKAINDYASTREAIRNDRQGWNEDFYEGLKVQNHNLGAEIRKIFTGGGLSFDEQLEKKRAEAEGLEFAEPAKTAAPKKGIFDDELSYRRSVPRSASSVDEDEEKAAETEEEKEPEKTYTLEDLERDAELEEQEEEKTYKKKDEKKGISGFFRAAAGKASFDEESFADEFDDLDEDDEDILEEYEIEDEEDKKVFGKKKKQGGFFSTGFGRSISRFLGIDPDQQDEDEEDEDEDDFELDYDIEDDDFDPEEDDGEESEGAEPGWMTRLREQREDEDVEADDADFSLYTSETEGGDDDEKSPDKDESTDQAEVEADTEEKSDRDAHRKEENSEDETGEFVSEDETGELGNHDEKAPDIEDAAIDAISAALLKSLDELGPTEAQDEDSYDEPVDAEDGDVYDELAEAEDEETYDDSADAEDVEAYEEPVDTEDEEAYIEPADAEDVEAYEEPVDAEDEEVYDEPTDAEDVEAYEEPVDAEDEEAYEEPADAEEEEAYEEPADAEDVEAYEGPADAEDVEAYEEPVDAEDEEAYDELNAAEDINDPDIAPNQFADAQNEDNRDLLTDVNTDYRDSSFGTDDEKTAHAEDEEIRDAMKEADAEEDSADIEESGVTEPADFLKKTEAAVAEDVEEETEADTEEDFPEETEGVESEDEEVSKKGHLSESEEQEPYSDFMDEDEYYDDEEEYEEHSFIANFSEMLRSAIESIRGGSSDKHMEKVKIPKREEKHYEEDSELMEIEALVSELETKTLTEPETDKKVPSEEEPSEAEPEKETVAEAAAEPESYEEVTGETEDSEAEPEEKTEAEAAVEPESYEQVTGETEDSEAEPEEEYLEIPESLENDSEEEDDREYEDSELDFADDDDSDIIIPGERRDSDTGIVIRGFDDDSTDESDERGSDDDEEDDDGYREDDWKIDYERITRASHLSDSKRNDDVTVSASEYEDAVDTESDYDDSDSEDFNGTDSDYEDLYDAEPEYEDLYDTDLDYEDPDGFAPDGDYYDDVDDEEEWYYEEDDDVVDASYESI